MDLGRRITDEANRRNERFTREFHGLLDPPHSEQYLGYYGNEPYHQGRDNYRYDPHNRSPSPDRRR
jgi:hypothetical protein